MLRWKSFLTPSQTSLAWRFATAHNLGDVIGEAFPEAGREIVSHPVDEHELRAGDGCGGGATTTGITDRVCQTVNHECW